VSHVRQNLAIQPTSILSKYRAVQDEQRLVVVHSVFLCSSYAASIETTADIQKRRKRRK